MSEQASTAKGPGPAAARSRQRVLLELVIPYLLILIVCWTPRPWQRALWLVAAGSIVIITCISFDGLDAMGLRKANFLRSIWVVGAALGIAFVAVAVAARLQTLHLPDDPLAFIETYWAYALWAAVQQFLLQCFFLSRLVRLLPGPRRQRGRLREYLRLRICQVQSSRRSPLSGALLHACCFFATATSIHWPSRMPSLASQSPSRCPDLWTTTCVSALAT
jgi:hypothetical protein